VHDDVNPHVHVTHCSLQGVSLVVYETKSPQFALKVEGAVTNMLMKVFGESCVNVLAGTGSYTKRTEGYITPTSNKVAVTAFNLGALEAAGFQNAARLTTTAVKQALAAEGRAKKEAVAVEEEDAGSTDGAGAGGSDLHQSMFRFQWYQ
jgi:hypothetical protein